MRVHILLVAFCCLQLVLLESKNTLAAASKKKPLPKSEAEDEDDDEPVPSPAPTQSPTQQLPTYSPVQVTFDLNRTAIPRKRGSSSNDDLWYIGGIGPALRQDQGGPTSNYQPPPMPKPMFSASDHEPPTMDEVLAAIEELDRHRAAIKELYFYEDILQNTIFPASSEYRLQLHVRMRRALLSGDPFVWSIMGMSNTAGHDNYLHESYPMVMEQALAPMMALAGMKLVVRNHAMGGTTLFPLAYCTSSVLGEDADVVGWEFHMTHPSYGENEAFVRNVLQLPKQPVTLWVFIGAGRAAPKEDEGGPLALPEQTEKQPLKFPFEDLISPEYIKFGMSGLTGKSALWWYDRFSPFTNPEMYKKTPGPGASWHPGMLLHQLYGLSLAYHYSEVLRDVLFELSENVPGSAHFDSESRQRHVTTIDEYELWRKSGLTLPLASLPDPIDEGCLYCNVSDNSKLGRPRCSTSATPTADESRALQHKVVPDDEVIGDFPNGNWTLELPKSVVPHRHMAGVLGHLDYKYVLRGTSETGWLTLAIDPPPTQAELLVCDTAHGWWREKQCGNLQANVEYYLDDTPLVFTRPLPDGYKTNRMAWCASLPVDQVDNYVGRKHQLHMRVVNTDSPEDYVYLQFLVWW